MKTISLLALVLIPAVPLSGCAWSHWQGSLQAVPAKTELITDARVTLHQRFRMSPDTPVAVAGLHTGVSSDRLHSARLGLLSRFSSVAITQSDSYDVGVLFVIDAGDVEPNRRSGWTLRLLPLDALLPASSKGELLRVHLLDAATGSHLGRADLALDPPLLRPTRADITRLGFEALAERLTGA